MLLRAATRRVRGAAASSYHVMHFSNRHGDVWPGQAGAAEQSPGAAARTQPASKVGGTVGPAHRRSPCHVSGLLGSEQHPIHRDAEGIQWQEEGHDRVRGQDTGGHRDVPGENLRRIRAGARLGLSSSRTQAGKPAFHNPFQNVWGSIRQQQVGSSTNAGTPDKNGSKSGGYQGNEG